MSSTKPRASKQRGASKDKSSSKEKTASKSSYSTTSSSKKREKAFDIMLNHVATKDGDYHDLVQSMSRLRTADAQLHKTMKTAEQNDKDPWTIRRAHAIKFKHFFKRVQGDRKKSELLDIQDDEFQRKAKIMQPYSAYLLFASAVRGNVKNRLGVDHMGFDERGHDRLSLEIANYWRDMPDKERQVWDARAKTEADLLAQFKEYVKSKKRSKLL